MTEIEDALSSVRKRDWRRLVRVAAVGGPVLLTDPGLPRPIVLAAVHDPDEHVTAVSHRGRTRGAWATGRAAAWLRGRAWTALVEALMPTDTPDEPLADDAAWAIGLLMPLEVPAMDTEDLTAANGRRTLRALANTGPGDEHAVMVRLPNHPEEVVMLATRGVWHAASPVAFHEDGPDSRVVRAGLWLLDISNIIGDVGHQAWIAQQSGRPWRSEHAADQVLAAADALGLPITTPA